MQTQETNPENGIELRTVRAATESMTVVNEEDGEFTVFSGESSEYTVDVNDGTCTCPDKEYNLDDGELCKHLRRCEMEAGIRDIPDIPGLLDVELMAPQATQPVLTADGGVEDECPNPECEYGQNKERPVLCFPHWREVASQ